ncbi:MAG: hypothetical protein AAF571_12425 [Verrucomicrobiota bacterium]
MKKYKWFVLAAAGLLAVGNWNANAEKGQRPSPEERQAKMEERFAQMSQELGLTADQESILKAQRESSMEQMQAIRQDDTLTREEKKEQMQALKEANQASLSSYLTSEQLQKLEELKAEREAQRAEMGGKKGKKGHCKGKKNGKGPGGGDSDSDDLS